MASRALARQLFTLVSAGGLLIWRYRQRHIRFFLGYVILVALIIPGLQLLWPWDFLGNRTDGHDAELPTLHSGRISANIEPNYSGRAFSQVATFTVTSPNPAQEFVPHDLSNAWFVWPNGDRAEVLSTEGIVQSAGLGPHFPDLLRRALPPVQILNLPERQVARFNLSVTSPMGRDRLLRENAVFEAQLKSAVIECEIAGELQLKPGSHTLMASRTTTLLESPQESRFDAFLTIRQSWLTGPWATALHRSDESNSAPLHTMNGIVAWHAPVYLLMNRARRQAIIGDEIFTARTGTEFGGYSTQTSKLSFSSEVIDPAWIKDAVLVCLRYRQVGTAIDTVQSAPAGQLK